MAISPHDEFSAIRFLIYLPQRAGQFGLARCSQISRLRASQAGTLGGGFEVFLIDRLQRPTSAVDRSSNQCSMASGCRLEACVRYLKPRNLRGSWPLLPNWIGPPTRVLQQELRRSADTPHALSSRVSLFLHDSSLSPDASNHLKPPAAPAPAVAATPPGFRPRTSRTPSSTRSSPCCARCPPCRLPTAATAPRTGRSRAAPPPP